ncbi:uncharacterized protein LOC141689683 [Apium graveolens]|uniref:uncharacterized protein LOC141689683 n=1 Tax=Apium graveolens TaxID=4045 RepID=UPI003D7AF84C
MWRTEGGCKVIDSGNHYIDFEVANNQLGRWRYTGFYGCPERGRRTETWNLLWSLAARSNLPWCVIGDFNDMMFVDKKRGVNVQPQYLLNGFVYTVNDCRLFNLRFKGEKFTWKKSRGKVNWIQERLDRGFATQAWKDLFPDAEVNVLEMTTSDHIPSYLHLNKKIYVPKDRRFMFENTWLHEKECVNVVRRSWEFTHGRSIMDKLTYCGLQL